MYMIKMIIRRLYRKFFNYGTIMKTFIKAERRLNRYRGEMLDEAGELSRMIINLEEAQSFNYIEAEKSLVGLKKLKGLFSE